MFWNGFTIKVNVRKQRRFDRSTVIFKSKVKRTQKFYFQLENDRRTVETSLFLNVNFYSEIPIYVYLL